MKKESTQAALGASPVKCKFGETEDKLSMVVDPIIVNVGQTLPSDLPHRCHQPLFFHLFLQAATLSENIGEGKRPQHQRSPGRNPNNPVLHPLVARPRLSRTLEKAPRRSHTVLKRTASSRPTAASFPPWPNSTPCSSILGTCSTDLG